MKKLVLSIIFSFFYINSFSQKQYDFDYLIEYKQIYITDSITKDSITRTKFYLTNSKDNSYLAQITDKDSLYFSLEFKQHDKVYSLVKILKSDFYKSDILKFSCTDVFRHRNKYKYQTKYYDFLIMNDTVIGGKKFGFYKLKQTNPKRARRHPSGTTLYIIDKSTNFHLPILSHDTAFEEWKLSRKLPKGIFFERIFVNHWGHINNKEKLIGYNKTNKKFIIEKDCDNYLDKP